MDRKQLEQCFDEAEKLYNRFNFENIPIDLLIYSCGHGIPMAFEQGLNNFLQTGLFYDPVHHCSADSYSIRKNCILCQTSESGFYKGITTEHTNFQVLYWTCVNFFRNTIYNSALYWYIKDVRKGKPFSIKETEDLVSKPGKLVIDILFDKAMQSPNVNNSVATLLKSIAQKTLILDIKYCGFCEGGSSELRIFDSSYFKKIQNVQQDKSSWRNNL